MATLATAASFERLVSSDLLLRALGRTNMSAQWIVLDPLTGGAVASDALIATEYRGTVKSGRLDVPIASRRELVADVVDLLHLGAGFGLEHRLHAEDVLAISLAGREVYAHDLLARIAQRAFVDVVTPLTEPLLSHRLWSFRRGRDRWGALCAARRLARRGFRFAAKVDVRRFFPSITVHHVVESLGALLPGIDTNIVRLAVWFCSPRIMRHSATGLQWEPPIYAALQGSIVAPMLSNIAGAVNLDAPMEGLFHPDVVSLRYCDDLLILSRDPVLATYTRDAAVELIEAAGWQAHPEKTSPAAVDLRHDGILFLGKQLLGGQVHTPRDHVNALVDRFVCEPEREKLGMRAAAIVQEMLLDPPECVRAVVNRLGDSRHARILHHAIRHFAARRRRVFRAVDSQLQPLMAGLQP